MKRKIPLRKCLGCQERKEKKSLLRIVRTPEGSVEIDRTGKQSGRGSYICFSKACLERAMKNRSLERALEVSIDQDILAKLMAILEAEDGH